MRCSTQQKGYLTTTASCPLGGTYLSGWCSFRTVPRGLVPSCPNSTVSRRRMVWIIRLWWGRSSSSEGTLLNCLTLVIMGRLTILTQWHHSWGYAGGLAILCLFGNSENSLALSALTCSVFFAAWLFSIFYSQVRKLFNFLFFIFRVSRLVDYTFKWNSFVLPRVTPHKNELNCKNGGISLSEGKCYCPTVSFCQDVTIVWLGQWSVGSHFQLTFNLDIGYYTPWP